MKIANLMELPPTVLMDDLFHKNGEVYYPPPLMELWRKSNLPSRDSIHGKYCLFEELLSLDVYREAIDCSIFSVMQGGPPHRCLLKRPSLPCMKDEIFPIQWTW